MDKLPKMNEDITKRILFDLFNSQPVKLKAINQLKINHSFEEILKRLNSVESNQVEQCLTEWLNKE